jgi:hypothetical protein
MIGAPGQPPGLPAGELTLHWPKSAYPGVGVASGGAVEYLTALRGRKIDKGTVPAPMVGNQCRLPLKDVLAYKADNRAKRRQTLGELAGLDQELGLE